MTATESPAASRSVTGDDRAGGADTSWLETLACPRCRAAIDDPSYCQVCDSRYRSDDGVPRLIAPGMAAEVRFEYVADGSADRLLADALVEPPVYAGPAPLPYHLDPAHARPLADLPPGSRVLEIGCGGGQNRAWVVGRGLRYVGTDVSRTRVFDWLQKDGGPDLLCDAHFLPFRDGQFDAVYAAATTEHLACPHLVVREVFRVLKPGGLFLGNVSFLEPWHDDSYFHMTPLGVAELLGRAGYHVSHVWPGRNYSGFHAIPAMAFRHPFKVARYLGPMAHGLYRLQEALRGVARRLRGRPAESAVRRRAVVAGAIDWIARRPARPTREGDAR